MGCQVYVIDKALQLEIHAVNSNTRIDLAHEAIAHRRSGLVGHSAEGFEAMRMVGVAIGSPWI